MFYEKLKQFTIPQASLFKERKMKIEFCNGLTYNHDKICEQCKQYIDRSKWESTPLRIRQRIKIGGRYNEKCLLVKGVKK